MVDQDSPAMKTLRGRHELVRTATSTSPPTPLPLVPAGELGALSPGTPTMHETPGASDTTNAAGVSSARVVVERYAYGKGFAGICPVFLFTHDGLVVTLCFRAKATYLVLLDGKETLSVLDARSLPGRGVIGKVLKDALVFDQDEEDHPGLWPALDALFRDTSGGAYMSLDGHERVVLPATDGTIRVVPIRRPASPAGSTRLCFGDPTTLSAKLPKGYTLVCAAPTWDGKGIWYTATTTEELAASKRPPIVGRMAYDGTSRTSVTLRDAERVQNAFAVGPRGAYVVTNHALYLIGAGETGLSVKRGEDYTRGRDVKPGQVDTGSGTTPTLCGAFVAIGDGASPMNVCVYDAATLEATDRKAFQFIGAKDTACENSFIYHNGNLWVGNTYGYRSPYVKPRDKGAGLARFTLDANGKLKAAVKKADVDVFTATPKLSTPNGWIYFYTTPQPYATAVRDETQAWYLTAVDARTLEPAWQVHTLAERGKAEKRAIDNAWATFSIAPNGDIYQGIFSGFVRIRARG